MDSITPQVTAAYDTYFKAKCSKLTGILSKEKSACRDLSFVVMLSKAIPLTNAGKAKCKTAKNPEKCVARFNKELDRYKKGLVKYKTKAQTKLAKIKAKK